MGEAELDPLVQYIVLRRDLQETEGWPLGALVAQAASGRRGCRRALGHAACRAYVAPDAMTHDQSGS